MAAKKKQKSVVRKVFAGIAIALAIIFALGALGYFVIYPRVKPSETETEKQQPGAVDEEGNAITNEGSRALPRLMTFTALSEESTTAQGGVNVTAEVLPVTADSKAVDWSGTWENAESEWATGKDPSDYVSITPKKDGSTTANISCSAAFGEPVIITVTSRSNPDVSATCTAHYAQRLEDFSVSFGDVVCDFVGGTTGVSVALTENETAPGGAMNLQVQLSDTYTVACEYQTSYELGGSGYFLKATIMENGVPYQENAFVFGDYTCAVGEEGGLLSASGHASHFQSGLTNGATVLQTKGLYFSIPFFVENFNLHFVISYGGGMLEKANIGLIPFPDAKNIIYYFEHADIMQPPVYPAGNYTEYSGKDLFYLWVKIQGKYTTLQKTTLFKMTDYVKVPPEEIILSETNIEF